MPQRHVYVSFFFDHFSLRAVAFLHCSFVGKTMFSRYDIFAVSRLHVHSCKIANSDGRDGLTGR